MNNLIISPDKVRERGYLQALREYFSGQGDLTARINYGTKANRVSTTRTLGGTAEVEGRDLTSYSDSISRYNQFIGLNLPVEEQGRILEGTDSQSLDTCLTRLKNERTEAGKNTGLIKERVGKLKILVPNEYDLDKLKSYLEEIGIYESQVSPNSNQVDTDANEEEGQRKHEINEELMKLRQNIETKIINAMANATKEALNCFDKNDFVNALRYIQEINKINREFKSITGISVEFAKFQRDIKTRVENRVENLEDTGTLTSKSISDLISLKKSATQLREIVTASNITISNDKKLQDYLKGIEAQETKNISDDSKISTRIEEIRSKITGLNFEEASQIYEELSKYNIPTIKDKVTSCQTEVKNRIISLVTTDISGASSLIQSENNLTTGLAKITEYINKFESYLTLDYLDNDLKSKVQKISVQLISKRVAIARDALIPKNPETREFNAEDAARLREEFEELIKDGGFMSGFQKMLGDVKKIQKFLRALSFLKLMLPEDMANGDLVKNLLPSLKYLEPAFKEAPDLIKTLRLLASKDGSFNFLSPSEKESYSGALIDYLETISNPARAGDTKNNIEAKLRSVDKILSILEGFKRDQSKNELGTNHWIASEIEKFTSIKKRYEAQLLQLEANDKVKDAKKEHYETKYSPALSAADRALDDYRKEPGNTNSKQTYESRADEYIKAADGQIEYIKTILKQYGNIKRILDNTQLSPEQKKAQAEDLFHKHLADRGFKILVDSWEEIVTKIEEFELYKDNPTGKLTEAKKTEIKGRINSELYELFFGNDSSTSPQPPSGPKPIDSIAPDSTNNMEKIPHILHRDIASFLSISPDRVNDKETFGNLRDRIEEIFKDPTNLEKIKKGVLDKDTAMAIYLFTELNNIDQLKPNLDSINENLKSTNSFDTISKIAEILKTQITESKDPTGPVTNIISGVDTSQTTTSTIDRNKIKESNKAFIRRTIEVIIGSNNSSNLSDDQKNILIEKIMSGIEYNKFTILEIYDSQKELHTAIFSSISQELNNIDQDNLDQSIESFDPKAIQTAINEYLSKVERLD